MIGSVLQSSGLSTGYFFSPHLSSYNERIVVDATSYRHDYKNEIEAFRALYREECFQTGVDYVPLDTSMQFDKALLEYLVSRQGRR